MDPVRELVSWVVLHLEEFPGEGGCHLPHLIEAVEAMLARQEECDHVAGYDFERGEDFRQSTKRAARKDHYELYDYCRLCGAPLKGDK